MYTEGESTCGNVGVLLCESERDDCDLVTVILCACYRQEQILLMKEEERNQFLHDTNEYMSAGLTEQGQKGRTK